MRHMHVQVLTVTIISLIVFFVFISHEDAKLRVLAVQVSCDWLGAGHVTKGEL